ncbi:hypothetical protein DJ93_4789 [Bacillus clarus]|uniref:Uncharacterized protein n=1 Tax=Bacillus clarus TaxID=2338372 RepID=A0A090YN61_9BACI|nr:hypothetical protein DJ93_4789 [Bacillus clarus]
MLKEWLKNNFDKSNCRHKYNFIRMQDNENFRKGELGAVYIYRCEK